jgi:hypothetical protein
MLATPVNTCERLDVLRHGSGAQQHGFPGFPFSGSYA